MDDFDGLRTVTRRQVLKGGAAVAALGGVSAFLAACSSTGATAAPASQAASQPQRRAGVRPGLGRRQRSRRSAARSASAAQLRPGPKAGMEAIDAAFTTETGVTVNMNTVDHDTFQDQISQLPRRHAGRPCSPGSPASA